MDIKEIFQTKTIKHFLVTSSGTIINGVLGLLFYIVVARSLGPGIFGIFSVTIASIALISDVADLGIDTGIIRFLGKYHQQDKNLALRFLKLGLEIKLAIWLVILICGWFLVPAVSQVIFLKSELITPLRLALIGALGAMLFSLSTHAIQAYQKFWAWSFLNIGINALRLLATIVLIFLALLNLPSALTIYITLPFLGFFVSFFILPNYMRIKEERKIGIELLNYSKWVAMVGILAALGSKLDIFLSARLLTSAQVGIYSVANQITSIIPQLIFALATVVAPKLAGFDNDQKAAAYLKKLQFLVGGIFILGLLALPIGVFFIPLIYGQAYQGSITPFIILFLSQLIFLLALPYHQAIFYYFAKPRLFIWVAIGQLLIIAIGGWHLISVYGVVGAASAVLISNLFSFLFVALWVIREFQKGK